MRIYEYERASSPRRWCDDDIAVVVTANFDNRSFRLDFELAAVIYGPTANSCLADAFLRDLEVSREITPRDLERMPFLTRLGQASARLLSPLL